MEPIVIAMGLATMLCVVLLVYALWTCWRQLRDIQESGAQENRSEGPANGKGE